MGRGKQSDHGSIFLPLLMEIALVGRPIFSGCEHLFVLMGLCGLALCSLLFSQTRRLKPDMKASHRSTRSFEIYGGTAGSSLPKHIGKAVNFGRQWLCGPGCRLTTLT
ncbi:hypothetical protein CapIbe_021546 [Capra ibex]